MFSSMKLTPTTAMGKQESKKVKTILQNIIDKPQSFDFQSPVDWKTLGLTDYPFIIKHPMDLGTVGQNLRNDKYRFAEQALDDIQLIWDNCKNYNQPQTWIYKTAENLERMFKKMIKNYLPHIPIIVPGSTCEKYSGQITNGRNQEKKPIQSSLFEDDDADEEVPYHQKMKFEEKLKHLSAEELGQVVEVIIQKCPDAFQEEGKDGAQLFLDNLDATTFQEVSEMVRKMNQDFEQRSTKRVKL